MGSVKEELSSVGGESCGNVGAEDAQGLCARDGRIVLCVKTCRLCGIRVRLGSLRAQWL